MTDLEKDLIKIMLDEKCSFSKALKIVFESRSINTSSVFDLVDFLENHLKDLDKVAFFMNVYTGKEKDFYLTFL